VREKACLGVGFRGVTVDRAANEHATGGPDASLTGAMARVLVIAARGDLEIARQVREVLA
jgi:acetate kinase